MIKNLKLLIMLIAVAVLAQTAEAKSFIKPYKNPLAAAIKKADISDSAMISASFKELSSTKSALDYSSNTPMTPASIQKLITMLPAMETLGKDYEFKTQLYKDAKGNLYIKLGADPYFSSKDMRNIIRVLNKSNIYSAKAIYIDDSILDSNEWGEGWQWDDDMNPLMQKFSAYNMDKNLITINICPTTLGAPADIATEVFYPTAFINTVVTGSQNAVSLSRKNNISPDVINADGTVLSDTHISIPVNFPRRYFILRLEETLRGQKIAYYGDFNRLKIPQGTTLITETSHSLDAAADDIIKKSNNMAAETVFKLAGGKYAKETGSMNSALEMFNDYYKKLGVSTDNIKIVDGSGVSKNNLITANFMTEALLKESQNPNFSEFKAHMASPGEGTLTDRMLYFKDNLKAKTGTLTNISAIAGYLTAKSGKQYAFCIMINDSKSKEADKKAFEEYVLREAFDKL